VALLTAWTALTPHGSRLHRDDIAALASYGMAASFASVLFLGVNICVRIFIIRSLGITSPAAAGFSMAYDLLQRPFSVVIAAFHMVAYPEVVASHEQGSQKEAQHAVSYLFELFLCPTILLLGTLIALLPDVAFLVVPADRLNDFLAFAPAACVFGFASVHLQMTGAVVPHLLRTPRRLIATAIGQFLGVGAIMAGGMAAGMQPTTTLMAAGVGTLLWMAAMAGQTWRFGALPRAGLILASALAGLIIVAIGWLPVSPLAQFVVKTGLAISFAAAIAYYGNFFAKGHAGRPEL
jgi:hypothetical protein